MFPAALAKSPSKMAADYAAASNSLSELTGAEVGTSAFPTSWAMGVLQRNINTEVVIRSREVENSSLKADALIVE